MAHATELFSGFLERIFISISQKKNTKLCGIICDGVVVCFSVFILQAIWTIATNLFRFKSGFGLHLNIREFVGRRKNGHKKEKEKEQNYTPRDRDETTHN